MIFLLYVYPLCTISLILFGCGIMRSKGEKGGIYVGLGAGALLSYVILVSFLTDYPYLLSKQWW